MPIETSEELYKLIKQANQRILRIERETGIKEGFATKQLLDYLSAQPINGVTAGGRIRFKKDYTFMQKQAIIKAIKEFKNQDTAGLRGLKKYKEYVSNVLGKRVSYKQSDIFYKATQELSWLFNAGITPSEYVNVYKPKAKTMDKESWIDLVAVHMREIPDRKIVTNLEILYEYIRNG